MPVNRARVEEAQRSGEFRDDLEPSEIGMFVNLVLNGLALQRAQGDESPRVELVLGLLEGRYRRPSSVGYASAYTSLQALDLGDVGAGLGEGDPGPLSPASVDVPLARVVRREGEPSSPGSAHVGGRDTRCRSGR